MDQPIESRNAKIEMLATTSSSPSSDQQHTFVVENLEGRIRGSVKQNSMPSDESQTSLQSTSSNLVPDPEVLTSLESYAKTISTNIDGVLRDLRSSLSGKFSDEIYNDYATKTPITFQTPSLTHRKYSTRSVCFEVQVKHTALNLYELRAWKVYAYLAKSNINKQISRCYL